MFGKKKNNYVESEKELALLRYRATIEFLTEVKGQANVILKDNDGRLRYRAKIGRSQRTPFGGLNDNKVIVKNADGLRSAVLKSWREPDEVQASYEIYLKKDGPYKIRAPFPWELPKRCRLLSNSFIIKNIDYVMVEDIREILDARKKRKSPDDRSVFKIRVFSGEDLIMLFTYINGNSLAFDLKYKRECDLPIAVILAIVETDILSKV